MYVVTIHNMLSVISELGGAKQYARTFILIIMEICMMYTENQNNSMFEFTQYSFVYSWIK